MNLFYCTGCYAVYKERVYCPNPICRDNYKVSTEPLEDESRDYVKGDKVRCLAETMYASALAPILHEPGHVYEVAWHNIDEINSNKAAYELVK